MNFKRFDKRLPDEYQELTFIANSGTQYIDTGLKGSDLSDCEIEIVMRNDTTLLTSYNFNGTFLSGSTAQFGLVATSSSECRSSMNFGFADAISTTGLNISEFHTIYATDGLQKVDNAVIGTLNFGTLNNGSFLLFARTDPNQTSGVNICLAMSLKSFTVKRNNQYIRNMIPAKRKSDNTFGLYDTVNDVFYTNQGTGDFTGGTVVEPTWQDIPHYIHNTSTDTLTTLPADIYANDTTATVGVKGDMSQSGTPSPTTPIQPQECGERTVQLWDEVYSNIKYETPTYRAIFVGNGTFTLSTTIPQYMNFANLFLIAGNVSSGATTERDGVWVGNPRTVESIDGYLTIAYRYYNAESNPNNGDTMLNSGSTPLPYEPYGYKIPILNNSQTTNVYLGEVQTTRKIKKLVLTGNEDWAEYGTGTGHFYYMSLSPYGITDINQVCSHYTSVFTAREGKQLRIYETYASITDFTTFLQQQYTAGTPVCVWYVLAEPTTGIVNEPIRKIGDYADEVSSITIPTIAGANTISVDTTLQPSEVTATYKGWHPVLAVHERESGAWD